MISVIVKITSRDFFRDSVTVGPTLTCIARAPYVRLFINLSEKRSVRRYCVTASTKLCFTGMPFFKVWVAASLMILVVFLLTTSWWIVWYLYEKYLTFFLLFTTILGYYIKWYHSSGEILITIFILHKYLSSFLDFWLFTDGRKIGPERIANAIKSQSFFLPTMFIFYITVIAFFRLPI